MLAVSIRYVDLEGIKICNSLPDNQAVGHSVNLTDWLVFGTTYYSVFSIGILSGD